MAARKDQSDTRLHPSRVEPAAALKGPIGPHTSNLVGAPHTRGGKAFGYSWFKRTFGLGAVQIKLSSNGDRVKSIHASTWTHVNSAGFQAKYATSRTTRWFELMKNELPEEVHVRLSADGNEVTAVKFLTTLRQSSWYGSGDGQVHKIVAPTGFYIHMLHGECSKRWFRRTCNQIGGHFVPRELHQPPTSECTYIGTSRVIGTMGISPDSPEYFNCPAHVVRAVVLSVKKQLRRMWAVSPIEYERYLAKLESAPPTTCVVELLADERITSVRALFDGACVTSVQLVTSHRTTEWFGSKPGKDVVIIERSTADVREATHIGGFCGMLSGARMRSLAAKYYKNTS